MNEEQKIKEEAEIVYPVYGNDSISEINRLSRSGYIAGASTRIPLLSEISDLKKEVDEARSLGTEHLCNVINLQTEIEAAKKYETIILIELNKSDTEVERLEKKSLKYLGKMSELFGEVERLTEENEDLKKDIQAMYEEQAGADL